MKQTSKALSIATWFVFLAYSGHSTAQRALPTVVIPGGIAPPIGTGPLPELPPPRLPNWGFEFGLRDWVATGTAFTSQPTFDDNVAAGRVAGVVTVGGDYWTDLAYPIGVQGQRWIGTYENRPSEADPFARTQGDAPQGTLTSTSFRLAPDQRYISFLIGGGRDAARLKVELLRVDPSGAILPISTVPAKTGHNAETLRRDWWNVSALDREKEYAIRITDASSAEWGHINVDDFRFLPSAPTATLARGQPTVIRASFLDRVTGSEFLAYADYGVPLWGSADLHTHPMSHLAMGRKLMHGAPDAGPAGGSIVPAGTRDCNGSDFRATTVEQALGHCNSTHGGWGDDNQCGDHIRAAVLNHGFDTEFVHRTDNVHGDHEHAGYPTFRFWPHYSSTSHQQMYVEWIRRAYQGGLRVMVALAVNNQLMGEVLNGDEPKDDARSADLQLDEIRAFVARHADFMRLVRTPAEMRRAVRLNKLAVVLGIEVDNFGNFNDATVPSDEASVLREVRRLHDEKGVRYILPIHLTDNVIGGAAVYDDLFNLANRYARSRPLPHGSPIPPGLLFQVETASDPLIDYRLGLFEGPPGSTGAALLGLQAALVGIGELPYPLAFDLFTCPIPRLGCLNQFRVIQSLLSPDPEWDVYATIRGSHENRRGLTAVGRAAIAEMMRLGMIIDIDHMGDKSANETLEIAGRYWYPINSGHNGFRGFGGSEKTRSDAQIERINHLGGLMGVGIAHNHAGGFLTSYRYGRARMGGRSTTLGSDINGFEMMPQPRHIGLPQDRAGLSNATWNRRVAYAPGGFNAPLSQYSFGERTWDYNVDGVAHMGLFPDYYQDLRNLGMNRDERSTFFNVAEDFAWMWETCELQAETVP